MQSVLYVPTTAMPTKAMAAAAAASAAPAAVAPALSAAPAVPAAAASMASMTTKPQTRLPCPCSRSLTRQPAATSALVHSVLV
eukprot:4086479-Pleurochrysis_carterae.AAC.2